MRPPGVISRLFGSPEEDPARQLESLARRTWEALAIDPYRDVAEAPVPGSKAPPLLSPVAALEALTRAMQILFPPQTQRGQLVRAQLEELTVGSRELGCGPIVPFGELLGSPVPSSLLWLEMLGVLVRTGPARRHDEFHDQAIEAWRILAPSGSYRILFRANIQDAFGSDRFLALFPSHLRDDWSGPVRLRAGTAQGRVCLVPPAPTHPHLSDAPPWIPSLISGWGKTATCDLRPAIEKFDEALEKGVAPRSGFPSCYTHLLATGLQPPRGGGDWWPASWPTWAHVEWQARDKPPHRQSFDLRLLRNARHQDSTPEQPPPKAEVWAERRLRSFAKPTTIAIDLGATTTCISVVADEHDTHPAFNIAGQLELAARPEASAASATGKALLPSGWLTLAGDPRRAGRFGCGDTLRLVAGYLPTAIELAERPQSYAPASLNSWLPQAHAFESPCPSVKRFKSPTLLEAEYGAEQAPLFAKQALGGYLRLLGETLACYFAGPRNLSAPWLPDRHSLRLVMTAPGLRWSSAASVHREDDADYPAVLRALAEEHLVGALRHAWKEVEPATHFPAESEVVRSLAGSPPPGTTVVFADLGGLTFQVAVELTPDPAVGLEPRHPGYSMEYMLGGDFLLDGLAYVQACGATRIGPSDDQRVMRRETLEQLIVGEGHLAGPGLIPVFQRRLIELLARQIEAAWEAGDSHLYWGSDVHLHLFGRGWLLSSLDHPSASREAAAFAWVQNALASTLTRTVGAPVKVVKNPHPKWLVCQQAALLYWPPRKSGGASEFYGAQVTSTRPTEPRTERVHDWRSPVERCDATTTFTADPWLQGFQKGWLGRQMVTPDAWRERGGTCPSRLVGAVAHTNLRDGSPLRSVLDRGAASLAAFDLCSESCPGPCSDASRSH